MSVLNDLSKELVQGKKIPNFSAGDRLRVMVRVREGTREREQAYTGVCIARHNNGINSSFIVRKVSYGEGVERIFPLYSPMINIIVERYGRVRRAKLYYLRQLSGKKARIAEDFEAARRAAESDAEEALRASPEPSQKDKGVKEKNEA